jgi:hypothetical protein
MLSLHLIEKILERVSCEAINYSKIYFTISDIDW